MSLVRFEHVTKAFGPKKIYTDLCLSVEQGETFTIIGGSGQGKSVMLKMLIGLLKPDSGEIYLDEKRIDNLRDAEWIGVRRRVGMLFQGGALFDSLSVGENIAYGLREHLKLSENELWERVAEALSQVGLEGIEAMLPADLSGGMRKRVALARAIVMTPEVIIYDEPTTGLDPVNTRRINELIIDLQRKLKITSIVVTHDMQSVFSVSDRIAMVHEGRIIFTGNTDELRASSLAEVKAFIQGA